jgi:hypothetical protein
MHHSSIVVMVVQSWYHMVFIFMCYKYDLDFPPALPSLKWVTWTLKTQFETPHSPSFIKNSLNCSSMALNFGHSTLLYMAWISSFSNLDVRFLHIGIHSFILIFIWANDFSDGWVQHEWGYLCSPVKFVLTLHLNYSSNWITYDGIDYICKYYCHPLQNYKSLLHWKANI